MAVRSIVSSYVPPEPLLRNGPLFAAQTIFNSADCILNLAFDLVEPPRVLRRLFGLSHAAMAGCSSMA